MPCVFSWLLEHAFPAKNWKVCRLLFSSDYFRFYKDQEPTATEFLLVAQARKFAKKGCIIYFPQVMNTKGKEPKQEENLAEQDGFGCISMNFG